MFDPFPALGARAAEVYSANIVGYTKINLSTGFNPIGISFKTTGTTEQTLNIQDVAKSLGVGLVGMDADTFAFGDELILWDAANTRYTNPVYWYGDDVADLGFSNVLIDGDLLEPVDLTIPVRGVFFIKSASSAAIATFVRPNLD